MTAYLGTIQQESNNENRNDRLFPEKEGWVTSDVEWLKETYHPGWVVFDTSSTDLIGLQPPGKDAIVQNDSYELYTFETVANAV